MKNFLEKLKDFLYDGIDYMMMLAIIIGVVLIINWRLNGLFAENSTTTPPQSSKPTTNFEDEERDIVNPDDDITPVEKDNKEDDKPLSSNKKNEATDDNPSNPIKEEKKEENVIVEINIPAGSASSSIGNILVNSGLIQNKEDFLKKLTESNLETKLRHGTYRIPKNSSLEKILNILTK